MLHRIAMMLQLLKSFDVHYNIFVSGDIMIPEKWQERNKYSDGDILLLVVMQNIIFSGNYQKIKGKYLHLYINEFMYKLN